MTLQDIYRTIQSKTAATDARMAIAVADLRLPVTRTALGDWIFHPTDETVDTLTVDPFYKCSSCTDDTALCTHAITAMFHEALETLPMPDPTPQSRIDAWAQTRHTLEQFITDHFVEGVDFYRLTISGTETKPSLSKSGSEKILQFYELRPTFAMDRETWEMFGSETGLLCYICTLINADGIVVAEGKGARHIKQDRNQNSTVKLALKSAQVDATLRLSGLSGGYTQDIEDMREELTATPAQPEHVPPVPLPPPPRSPLPPRSGPPRTGTPSAPETTGKYTAHATKLRVYVRPQDGMVFFSVLADDLPKEHQTRGIPIWKEGFEASGMDYEALSATPDAPPVIAGMVVHWHEWPGANGKMRQCVNKLVAPHGARSQSAVTGSSSTATTDADAPDDDGDIPF